MLDLTTLNIIIFTFMSFLSHSISSLTKACCARPVKSRSGLSGRILSRGKHDRQAWLECKRV